MSLLGCSGDAGEPGQQGKATAVSPGAGGGDRHGLEGAGPGGKEETAQGDPRTVPTPHPHPQTWARHPHGGTHEMFLSHQGWIGWEGGWEELLRNLEGSAEVWGHSCPSSLMS